MDIFYKNKDSELKYNDVFEAYIIKTKGMVHSIDRKFVEELKKDRGLVEAIKKTL